jgi:hypothetical protein
MPRKLTDWDLRTIAEVTSEMSKFRGAGFDAHAQALAFARAAQVDADFRARLAEIARRIEARRGVNMLRKLFVPVAPLFRDLEREAEAILGREG